METQTLKKEEENQQEDNHQSNHQTTTTISFPNEIVQDILSRLPVKPILQFRSVSKQWLSLISHDPSFPKLHFNHSLATNRTALFIDAYDTSTRLRHFLSAPLSGGHVTHLMTLHNAPSAERETTEAEHLSGLVLFTSGNNDFLENNNDSFAFIINPANRNIYKLPDPPGSGYCHMCYFFGFDEFKNEHKVFNIKMPGLESKWSPRQRVVEFMIFSLLDYSWRKIDVGGNLPVDFCEDRWSCRIKSSVCVNSAIHVMLRGSVDILVFDLRTEKFEIIKVPNEALPFEYSTRYTCKDKLCMKYNYPVLLKVDGLLGVLSHDRVVERNEMYLWVLEDYENRVWVRKTIAFSESWVNLDTPFPLCSGDVEEILFSLKRLSRNTMSVPVYDLKTGSFKSLNYFLGHQFLRSKTLKFNQVTSYIESIVPLVTNELGTS